MARIHWKYHGLTVKYRKILHFQIYFPEHFSHCICTKHTICTTMILFFRTYFNVTKLKYLYRTNILTIDQNIALFYTSNVRKTKLNIAIKKYSRNVVFKSISSVTSLIYEHTWVREQFSFLSKLREIYIVPNSFS